MDDFNNKLENENQTAESKAAETQTPAAEPQAQQNDSPAQPQQEAQPQAHEEPRTPFQTPVQHPAYQTPRERANAQQPQQQPQNNGIPYSDSWQQQDAMPPKHHNKKGGRKLVIGLCSVAAACLLFAGGAVTTHLITNSTQSDTSASVSTNNGSTPTMQISSKPSNSGSSDATDGLAGEDIYKKVSPSVVSVISTTSEGTGSGSGVIMSKDGYIITNNHVVEGAQSVSVQLSDSSSLDATIVGTDEQTDLAVLKVEPDGTLTAAEFGNSDELQPGEYAYALGSPGGVQFANTITGGRISAINRDVTINDRVMTLIQTDASINPGNSGGALINKYGQVVGITSAKLSSNAFSEASIEGMGFAIPINMAKEVVDELIVNGYVAGRPSIGISGYNVESADGSIAGVQVDSIDSRAKAADEGLQVGDVIVAVDGTPTPTMDDVNEVKEDKKAGDKITLTVYRISTGKRLNVTITLMDAHDLEGEDPAAQDAQSQQDDGSQYYQSPFPFFGW